VLNIYLYISTVIITEAKDVDPRDARLKTTGLRLRASSRYLEKRPALARDDRPRFSPPRFRSSPFVTNECNEIPARQIKGGWRGAYETANRNLLSRFREPKSGKGHLAARKCVVPTTTRDQMVHQ